MKQNDGNNWDAKQFFLCFWKRSQIVSIRQTAGMMLALVSLCRDTNKDIMWFDGYKEFCMSADWSVLAPLGVQDVTFILQGPPKPVPVDLDTLISSRCGWLKQGMKGWRALQFPYSEQIKAAAKTVACVYLWWEGTDFDFREEETCRRFDLWGSEHDNYYLPSKKLTTALRTSKHLFPFYYVNKCKQMLDGYI